MFSPDSIAAASPVTARVRSSVGRRTVIEIEYEGTEPPLDLFAELGALGWTGAVPCGPPAAAIDWSRPDSDRGTQFSVRPFRAVVAVTMEGTPDERGRTVERARIALERHAQHRGGGQTDVVELGPRTATATAEVTCAERRAPAVRAALAAYGVVTGERSDTVVMEGSFRGSPTFTKRAVRRMDVTFDADRYQELVGTLSLHGVQSIRRTS